MEVKIEFPPNYELLKKVFKIADDILFCYGHILYNPSNCYIDPIVMKHEEVHERQQGDNPEEWWNRYMIDSAFRTCEEISAYQAQYKALCKITKDRNKLFQWLHQLATDLSSPTYGGIITYDEAIKAIKSSYRFKV
jgi:hypothetical protein